MHRSIEEEIQGVNDLICSARAKASELLQNGKKVHFIWDFDSVLASSRSDDVFAITNFDLKAYFAYEERLLFESPEAGPWLLPIAHNTGISPRFPPECFTQDIVTARSSTLSIRVQIFCIVWHLPIRWMLFLGHQPKKESYRIILNSLKSDPNYHIFCVDDSVKHIEAFRSASAEEGMGNRTYGIVSPVIRTYTEGELREYLNRVMSATGNAPIRVRSPSDDLRGFIVLPKGLKQFKERINGLVSEQNGAGHHFELKNAFVKEFGKVGEGRFKTEEELELAMKEFIMGLCCP